MFAVNALMNAARQLNRNSEQAYSKRSRYDSNSTIELACPFYKILPHKLLRDFSFMNEASWSQDRVHSFVFVRQISLKLTHIGVTDGLSLICSDYLAYHLRSYSHLFTSGYSKKARMTEIRIRRRNTYATLSGVFPRSDFTSNQKIAMQVRSNLYKLP